MACFTTFSLQHIASMYTVKYENLLIINQLRNLKEPCPYKLSEHKI
jgi:hypothetical protein